MLKVALSEAPFRDQPYENANAIVHDGNSYMIKASKTTVLVSSIAFQNRSLKYLALREPLVD